MGRCCVEKRQWWRTLFYRMDVIWAHIRKMKASCENLMFEKRTSIGLLALSLPHLNAEERVFSMIGKISGVGEGGGVIGGRGGGDDILAQMVIQLLANVGRCAE